ncbi:DMT family transporter [Nisaea nitritireducens]|uniref:DMT family transporter n=1 Tax=Nisaea nitritireducens TaxID=568392 RepID=UPI001866F0DD|nr:DMT family transporter [Nisaea nitritireducens]
MALWHKYSLVAYLAVFVGVLGHASTEFFAVLSGVSGPELSVWRFLLGGAGLVLVAIVLPGTRDLVAPFRTHGLKLLFLSLLGVTIGYLVFHWSLDFASVPQVATLVTTIPIFVAISNLLINKAPITRGKIASGLCAVVGIALLITDGYVASLAGSGESLLGIFLATACAAAVAAYSVLVRPIIAIYGALRITAITMMLGGIGLWLVVGLFFGVWAEPSRLAGLGTPALTSLLVIAFWNTTITQFLWIGGLAAVPDITRGSYLFFLKPVIAALLAVLVLGQDLSATQILAIIVITGSVFGELFLDRKPED